MRTFVIPFLSLVSIASSAVNPISETMSEKCNNTHGTTARYTCQFDNEGSLIFILREDPTTLNSNQYFKSKKVWLNKDNEQLTHVEEYSENGELKLVVHFDEHQRVIQSKTRNENREIIKNFKSSQVNDKKLNLSSQYILENQNYLSGFTLDWAVDEKSGHPFVKKWTQLGPGQKTISSFESRTEINCNQPNLKNRVVMMLAEGMNMDIHLPRFTKQLFYNNHEKVDGIDNDNNGLIDDCIGFNMDEKQSSHLSAIYPLIPEEDGNLQGVNHGTMVADIATRDNSKVLLYPASGSIREPLYYEKMSQMIQKNQIRLVNMSFSFSKNSSTRLDSRESMADAQSALEKLIQDHPNTLFVTAAGNGPFEFPSNKGVNVDSWKQYPVSFNFDHILSVGAIESSEVNKNLIQQYRLAPYSNYGLDSVDVLAPGTGVDMVRPGGLTTETTHGTSFSAPFVSNLISQAMILNPSLSPIELKELLIKTVYIPDLDLAIQFNIDNSDIRSRKWEVRKKVLDENPLLLPVKSGGIVSPDRFLAAAKWLSVHPLKTIEEAAIHVRSIDEFKAPTETGSENEKLKLIQFWKSRGL